MRASRPRRRARPWRRRLTTAGLIALVGVLSLCLLPGAADAKGKRRPGVAVKVMTYNAAVGTGLSARFATSLDELCDKAGENVREIDATHPPVRMRAIANQILKKKPDLVGLQEADEVLTQTPPDNGPLLGGTSATTVRYDFIKLILDRLNRGKRRYRLVDRYHEFEFETKANVDGVGSGCDASEMDARLITRNAILARVKAGVRTSRVRRASFRNQLNLNLFGVFPLTVPRGWESVDARIRGSRKIRFVNTHLEAFDNNPTTNHMLDTSTNMDTVVSNGVIRETQAGETVDGPAKSKLPVVLLGDLNSNVPGVKAGDELAFKRVLAAGFKRRSTQTPPSCCADPVTGTLADFDHVVDHILGKPGKRIRLLSSAVVGRARVNGLFPSDHAGVFSVLRVRRG